MSSDISHKLAPNIVEETNLGKDVEPVDSGLHANRSSTELGGLARVHENTFQAMLASHLAACINYPPSMKIRMICEAGLSVSWRNPLFADVVSVLSAQNIAIENSFTWVSEGRKICSVRWSESSLDTIDKYIKFFQPWDQNFPTFETLLYNDAEVNTKAYFDRLQENFKFRYRTKYLTDFGLHSLKSCFYQYAMPLAMNVFKQVAYRIDPSSLANAGIQEIR